MIFAIADKSIELDLNTAEQQLSDLETLHRVQGSPTHAFLQSVATWLSGLGVPECTPAIAWAVWWAVFQRIDQLRQQATRDADIAYWFKVNPFELTSEQKIALHANLQRVRAQQRLDMGKYSPTDYRGVYQLVLAATGSKIQAEAAQADALELFVDSRLGAKNE